MLVYGVCNMMRRKKLGVTVLLLDLRSRHCLRAHVTPASSEPIGWQLFFEPKAAGAGCWYAPLKGYNYRPWNPRDGATGY